MMGSGEWGVGSGERGEGYFNVERRKYVEEI